MQRDNRKSTAYFENLLPQYIEGLESLYEALADGSSPLPDEQTGVANDIYDLRVMYAIACYSAGESVDELKPKVAAILDAKKLFIETANTLPQRQQIYRQQFENLSGDNEINGIHPITHYIEALWWLSLAVATKQSKEHCLEILQCIGNRGEDALLDRIAIALDDEDQSLSPTLLYPHLYRPLLQAFDAAPIQQITLVKTFLKDWYSSCWQAAWYNNHGKEDEETGNWDFYFGYWSLEAGLIVNLLNIDDTSFEGNTYYPEYLSSTN